MTLAPEPVDDEAEVRRRLADLAATTRLDPGAWDEIHLRIARPRPGRRRLAAAAAAVLVLVAGAIVSAGRDGDGSDVRTDDTTTTTTERDRTTTTSTTPSTTTAAPAPTAEGALPVIPGEAPGTGSAGGRAGGNAGTPAETGTGPAGPATGVGDGVPPPPPSPTPAGPTAPDGRAPTVTFPTAGGEVQATAWQDPGGGASINLWGPDGTHVATWTWAARPGQNCLGGDSATMTSPGAPDRTLTFGFVRADAGAVRLYSTSQLGAYARVGPEVVPGLRAWIGEAPGPLGSVQARGNNAILHTVSGPAPFDAYPDTC